MATVKALKEEIRSTQADLISYLNSYYSGGVQDLIIDKEVAYLKEVSGTKRQGLPAMSLRGKTKAELQVQLSEMKYAVKLLSEESPKGRRERTEKELKAWRTFKRNKGGLSFENWRKMANVFGAAGESLMKYFGGSSDTQVTIEEAVKKHKSAKSIVNAMQQTVKELKGQGLSSTDYVDALREKLGLN